MGEVQYHIGETLDEALKGETEQSFDPREFGYDEVGFVDSVELSVAEDDDSDTGKTYMLAATCSEDLRFHRGQYPELFEPFEDEDEEPELTQEAMNAVEAVFSEQYSGIDIYGFLSVTVHLSISAHCGSSRQRSWFARLVML